MIQVLIRAFDSKGVEVSKTRVWVANLDAVLPFIKRAESPQNVVRVLIDLAF